MSLYFVDYDLRKQRNYDQLYKALQGLGARRFLESSWALRHNNSSCERLRDYLRQFIDADDGVMVSEVTNWASWKASGDPNKV